MVIVTKQAIYGKVRRLTGSDYIQLPDTASPSTPDGVGLDDYLNSSYLYSFIAKFLSNKLLDSYTFNTVAHIQTYPFNSEMYRTVQNPVYCAKRPISLYFDPYAFALQAQQSSTGQFSNNFSYGNGTSGPYGGYTNGTPVIRSVNNNPYVGTIASPYTPGSPNYGTPNVPGNTQGNPPFPVSRVQNILITANTATASVNVTDDGNGNLIGDLSTANVQGTINYLTGQIQNVYFSQAIPQGNAIQIQYRNAKESIPFSILFFQNQFTLSPIPDKGYTIDLVAFRQPSYALFATAAGVGTPELSEWWETIAFMMAKKVFQDRLDTENESLMDKYIAEALAENETTTYAQIVQEQVQTIYRGQLSNNNQAGAGAPYGV